MKAGRRHRYYVSNRLIAKGPDLTGWRLPDPNFEATVANVIADHLDRAAAQHRLLAAPDLRADPDLNRTARKLATLLRKGDPALLEEVLVSGTLGSQKLTLILDRSVLSAALGVPADDLAPDFERLTTEVRLRRRGVEAKLIVGDRASPPDPVLLRTLLNARRWVQTLRDGTPLKSIAYNAGHHEVHIRTHAQLAFLSPKIQRAIVDGTLPPEVTLHRILARPVPLDWAHQERLYGIARSNQDNSLHIPCSVD